MTGMHGRATLRMSTGLVALSGHARTERNNHALQLATECCSAIDSAACPWPWPGAALCLPADEAPLKGKLCPLEQLAASAERPGCSEGGRVHLRSCHGAPEF